jgi:uncharacterized protein DUF4886
MARTWSSWRSSSLAALVWGLVVAAAAIAAPKPLRVLFVGNSYTFVNDLPRLVAEMSRAVKLDRPIETDSVVEGGATLKQLFDAGKALAAIRSGKFDAVVLQEQSQLPILDRKSFHESVRKFHAEIEQAKAKTVLYVTWARQNAPKTQSDLTEAYATIAKELGATLAPVGPAFERALADRPKISLFDSDGSHPSEAGSYLAACVFVEVLAGKPPKGAPARIPAKGQAVVDVDAHDAESLQRAAHDVVSPAKH